MNTLAELESITLTGDDFDTSLLNSPRLMVRDAETPVQLKSVAIQTRIQDGFAETSMDMIFFNPNRRILEGELQFPLLPGQEISGISLDIDGELRAGVPVGKARGKQVFEEIVRRRVDPALLEVTEGNSYRLRVYPIPATGCRRIVVRFLQPLTPEKGMYSCRLPLEFAKNLENFSLEAIVVSPNGKPEISVNNPGLILKQAGYLYQGKVEKSSMAPEGWLEISLPVSGLHAETISAVRWKDKIYFSAAVHIPVKTQRRTLPDVATIIWDASGSGRKRDHVREFALLDQYFQAFDSGEVRLLTVRNRTEAVQTFSVANGNWNELKTALAQVVYDGGTDLASWCPTDDCPEYLLFTDGLANFGSSLGERTLPQMKPGQRLFPITASVASDHTILRHAALGQPVIDLMQNTIEEAAAMLLMEGTGVFLDISDLAGQGDAHIDPQAKILVSVTEKTGDGEESEGEIVRLAGWIRDSSVPEMSSVTLSVRYPDGSSKNIPVSLPVRDVIAAHDGVNAEDAPLHARLWARYAVSELEGDHRRNRAAITRISEEYGIVIRETSLVVLETAADYVHYDIRPPVSMEAAVQTYRKRYGTPGEKKHLTEKELLARWRPRLLWWEETFPLSEKEPTLKPESNPPSKRPVPDGFLTQEEVDALLWSIHSLDDDPEVVEVTEGPRTYNLATMEVPRPERGAHFLMQEDFTGSSFTTLRQESGLNLSDEDEAVMSGRENVSSSSIQLQPWRPDAPYIERMLNAKDADLYAIYIDERPGYEQNSAFFIDVADRFFVRGMKDMGLRILSNLAELELENRQILRMLAYRLIQEQELAFAQVVLNRIFELAPHEPQSLRDLALVEAKLGNTQKAADILYEVATRHWDSRFRDINVIALTERNALAALSEESLQSTMVDKELQTNLASDIRVVLTWDTDNVDLDLWVTDPSGEAVGYTNTLSRQGGRISRDVTRGYGPEEFMLRRALPGIYKVEVDYYGSHQQKMVTAVTLSVSIFTNFGRPDQEEKTITMRLAEPKSGILAGEFTVGQ